VVHLKSTLWCCADAWTSARRFDANAAFPVTPDTLATYLAGFEEPRGEGEDVIAFGDPS